MKNFRKYFYLGLLFFLYAIIFIYPYQLELDGKLTYPLFDDGMISLEYARNFALTGKFLSGMQTDQTIGFTSYLWVLSLAAISKLGFGALKLPYAAVVLNIIILMAALFFAARLFNDTNQSRRWRLIFLSLSLSSPAVLFWTLRGMEVPLAILMLAIFLNFAIYAKEKNQGIRILIFCGLASMATPFARPDQAPIVIAIAALLAAHHKYKSSAVMLSGLAIGQYLYSILNEVIFGQAASNSYFLKVTGTTLTSRLERFSYALQDQLQHHWLYLAVFSGFVLAIVASLKKLPSLANANSYLNIFIKNFKVQLIFLLLLVGISIWVFIGGDGWEPIPVLNRFLTSLLPFFILLICFSFQDFWRDKKVTYILISFLILNAFFALRMIGFDRYNDKKYSYLGYSIGKEFGNSVTVLNYWYGQPTYYANIFGTKSIDGLGKIDPIVAQTIPKLKFWPGHDRWNHEHSIGMLRPDLIIGMPCPKSHDPGFNCNAVWDEIVKKYQYQPHTSQEGYTVFVSPTATIPDLNVRIEELNQRIYSSFIKFRK